MLAYLHPLSFMYFSELLSETFDMFSANFRSYVFGIALFSALFIGIGTVTGISALHSQAVQQATVQKTQTTPQGTGSLVVLPTGQMLSHADNVAFNVPLVGSLRSIISVSLALVVLLYFVAQAFYLAVASGTQTFRKIIARALSASISLLLGYILVIIIVGVMSFAFLAAAAIGGALVPQFRMILGIGAIVLVIFLAPRFCLMPAIIVKEQKSAFAGIRESFDRSSGSWTVIFVNLLICNVLLAIVFGLIGKGLALVIVLYKDVPHLALGLSVLMIVLSQLKIAIFLTFLMKLSEYVSGPSLPTSTKPLMPKLMPSARPSWPPKSPQSSGSTPASEAPPRL